MAENGCKRARCDDDVELLPAAAAADFDCCVTAAGGVAVCAVPAACDGAAQTGLVTNILVVGTGGNGKSHFVNWVINPAGKGKSPLQSNEGALGVSLIPVRFVKRHALDGYAVRVVPHERAAAVRALQEAFFCATEQDLQATISRVYNIPTIDELLQQCVTKLGAAAKPAATMEELTAVLKEVNTLCLSEDSKASTREFYAEQVHFQEDRIASIESQRTRRVNNKTGFTKEVKQALLAELPNMREKLDHLRARMENVRRITEALPLGNVTKWIEVTGFFADLPDHSTIIDSPGWGDAYDSMMTGLFASSSSTVVVLVSRRVGGDEDTRELARVMRDCVLASPPSYSPVIVSLASCTPFNEPADNAKELSYLTLRWKTSVFNSIPEPTNPRLRALADRAYTNADVLINSDNFAEKLADFVRRAANHQPLQQEQQQQQHVQPLVHNHAQIDIADLLRKRFNMLGTCSKSLKQRTLADNSVSVLTKNVCVMQAMPAIRAAAWANVVNDLCDSVAAATNLPGRKYALDSRATPNAVMVEICTALCNNRANFDEAVDNQLFSKLCNLFAEEYVTNEEMQVCYAECNVAISTLARTTVENICAACAFSTQAPVPEFDDEPIVDFEHCAAYTSPTPKLTPAEQRALASAIKGLAEKKLDEDSSSSTNIDVSFNKALLPNQAVVTYFGIELGKDVHSQLDYFKKHDDQLFVSMVASASAYDDYCNLNVNTYTGASITFIWVKSPEDLERAIAADKAAKEDDPKLFDEMADRRIPRVFQHAQQRVFVQLPHIGWSMDELMNAICKEYGIDSWLRVPAGFNSLQERLLGAPFRRRPVYDLQDALRWMQICYKTAQAEISNWFVLPNERAAALSNFGGISFGNSFLPELINEAEYGLVSVNYSPLTFACKFGFP